MTSWCVEPKAFVAFAQAGKQLKLCGVCRGVCFFCFCVVRLLRVGKLRAILKVAWQTQDFYQDFHEN